MSLSEKSILLVTDDPAVRDSIVAAIKPVVKSVLVVGTASEALKKTSNQAFDCILHRTLKASLPDPKHLFQWAAADKAYKSVPWVILGKDIEDESIIVSRSNVKFLDPATDGAMLIKILGGLFFSHKSMSDKPASGSQGIDVTFLNPLVGAVVEVLKSMAQVDLRRLTPFIRKPSESPVATWDISGIIAMNSDRFLGSMAVSFERSLILKIYENMLATKSETITDEVKDAVSELTNIIFGKAKRDLNENGHTIGMALPSVVTGPGHEIRHAVSGHCLCIPFETDDGKLMVECVLSPR